MAKSKRSNRDHAHQSQTPSLNNEVIAADLEALLTPALYAQQKYYRLLGMRERVLNLSLTRISHHVFHKEAVSLVLSDFRRLA